VLGNEGLRFTGSIQTKLELTLQSLDSAQASQSIVLLPDSDEIHLSIKQVDWDEKPKAHEHKSPYEVTDFQMYNDLFGLSQSNPHRLWVHRDSRPFIPGDECIPWPDPFRNPGPPGCPECGK
jgi:hypothetical protein